MGGVCVQGCDISGDPAFSSLGLRVAAATLALGEHEPGCLWGCGSAGLGIACSLLMCTPSRVLSLAVLSFVCGGGAASQNHLHHFTGVSETANLQH